MKPRLLHLSFFMIFGLLFLEPGSAHALMTSANYRVWADTVSGGGNRSTSASYISTDTISESNSGEDPSSANFLLDAGLPAIFQEPIVTLTVSAAAITLGDITTAAVSSASYTVTVTTNAQFGYTARITEDGNFRSGANDINDVLDGTVTAGSEEYGIAVAGADAAFAGDQPVSGTALTIATRADWITSSVTTVTHRAAAAPATISVAYAHAVTHTVVGNF
ncbi:hypothetical protein HY478_00680 [Candidatus Uhrbacteria bacterium]|nr:hypothetical protein [Candidatus Uhrbacteria bacterium]